MARARSLGKESHRHHHRHRGGPPRLGGDGPRQGPARPADPGGARGADRAAPHARRPVRRLPGRSAAAAAGPRAAAAPGAATSALALLRLLAEEPRNGYQLMQTIEERSDGRWRPSPGSVYPTLAQLEDEGLIRSTERDGARRSRSPTPAASTWRPAPTSPPPGSRPTRTARTPLTELGPLVIRIGKAAWQVASVGDEAQRARAIELLAETRRAPVPDPRRGHRGRTRRADEPRTDAMPMTDG